MHYCKFIDKCAEDISGHCYYGCFFRLWILNMLIIFGLLK